METKKVLFVEEGEVSVGEIEKVYRESGLEVVGVTGDGRKGIELFDSLKPDFLVTGLVLSGADGFEVLEHAFKAKKATKIIVVSAIKNETIIKRAMDYGAQYYMTTPIPLEVVKERLLNIAEKDKNGYASFDCKPAKSIEEKISKIFISVGIPPHIKGYSYLREGVKMAVDNPKIINSITKQLYPKIGEKYETSASKVERAIRHAIEVAWNRNRIESINSVFGVRAYVGSEKPTNGEFIALVADKMLLEGA